MNAPANQLDVDPAALNRELDSIELPENSSPPGEPGVAGQDPGALPPDAPPPASWAPITPGIIAGVDLFVCPGWKLTDAEKLALSDALTPALDQAFPGGLGDEKYAPWFRLLIVVGGVAALRYDRATGKLASLRPKKESPPAGEGATQGAGFSTASDAGQ